MAMEIGSTTTQQQVNAFYDKKVDGADDNLQQLKDRLGQLQPEYDQYRNDSRRLEQLKNENLTWDDKLLGIGLDKNWDWKVDINEFLAKSNLPDNVRNELAGIQARMNSFDQGNPPKIAEYANLPGNILGEETKLPETLKQIEGERKEALKQLETETLKAAVDAKLDLSDVDLKSMDLESALMYVQAGRARLLEEQLKGQMQDVQARNKEIAGLNDIMSVVRSIRPNEDGKLGEISKDQLDFLKRSGVVLPQGNQEDGKFNKTECDTVIESMKGKIDSLNATQQTDMLRLQSLTNKRNEAFEIMTNFISKMAKARDSIISNLR